MCQGALDKFPHFSPHVIIAWIAWLRVLLEAKKGALCSPLSWKKKAMHSEKQQPQEEVVLTFETKARVLSEASSKLVIGGLHPFTQE